MKYDYIAMASVRPPKRTDAPIQAIQRHLLPEPEAPEFSEADERMFQLVECFKDNTEIVMYAQSLYEQGIYPTIAGLAKVVMMRKGGTSFVMGKEIADAMGLPYQDEREMAYVYTESNDGIIIDSVLIRYSVREDLNFLSIYHQSA